MSLSDIRDQDCAATSGIGVINMPLLGGACFTLHILPSLHGEPQKTLEGSTNSRTATAS